MCVRLTERWEQILVTTKSHLMVTLEAVTTSTWTHLGYIIFTPSLSSYVASNNLFKFPKAHFNHQ